MGMKYAEEPFNMGMFIFLPKASFSDPQHTYPGIFILGRSPRPQYSPRLLYTDHRAMVSMMGKGRIET